MEREDGRAFHFKRPTRTKEHVHDVAFDLTRVGADQDAAHETVYVAKDQRMKSASPPWMSMCKRSTACSATRRDNGILSSN